jgi:hypothetical protein
MLQELFRDLYAMLVHEGEQVPPKHLIHGVAKHFTHAGINESGA